MRIAYEAHDGQLDRGKYPYIAHPLHVAEEMTNEYETAAALLHDVVEDCGEVWYTEFKKQLIPNDVIDAVIALTQLKNTSTGTI